MPQNNPCVTNGLLPPDIYDTNLNTQLTYNIDFDFVAEEDVVVFLENPADTYTLLTNSAATGASPPNYTINQGVSPSQVTFNVGEPPGGVRLIIGRRTDICDPVVTYQVGAAIRAGDLNASNIQLLHLIQELRSTLGFMINGNDTDPIIPGTGMDLNDLDDVNVGDPVSPDPALLRYDGTNWVGNAVIESTDAWVANDSSFATTAAGDARWLQSDGSDITAGAGLNKDTSTAGEVKLEVDLWTSTIGTPSGLETSLPDGTISTADDAKLKVKPGAGIVLNALGTSVNPGNGISVAGDAVSAVQGTGVIINANGINGETTEAAIVQTGGTDTDPAIQIKTTIAGTVTDNNLVIRGGANTTVTRDSDTQLTIDTSGGTGLTYRGTVNVTNNATLPTDSNVNDVYANDTQGTQTANWQTVITGASTTANAGDLLLCTTEAGGTATNARYTLIASGTPGSGTPNLQQVLDVGNQSTSDMAFIASGNETIGFDASTGAAQFNANQNQLGDFRVGSDTQANMLFVDASANRVGIGTNAPTAPLDVSGAARVGGNITAEANDVTITARGGASNPGNLAIQEGTFVMKQTIDPNMTSSYTLTYPPAGPANANQILQADGSGNLSWINTPSAGASLWTLANGNLQPTTNGQGIVIRNSSNTQTAGISDTGLIEGSTLQSFNNAVLTIGTPSAGFQIATTAGIVPTERPVPTASGDWNIQDTQVWNVPANANITFPDNTRSPVAGQTGIFVMEAGTVTWTNANGGTWSGPNGTLPTTFTAGAIVPFYVDSATLIRIGNPTAFS